MVSYRALRMTTLLVVRPSWSRIYTNENIFDGCHERVTHVRIIVGVYLVPSSRKINGFLLLFLTKIRSSRRYYDIHFSYVTNHVLYLINHKFIIFTDS